MGTVRINEYDKYSFHHYDRYLCYDHAHDLMRQARLEPGRFPRSWDYPKCLFIPLARCWECSPLTENELRNRHPEMFGED